MVDRVEKIWMNGEMVRWEDANVHILTHTLHYGVGAFEGIRSYRRGDGTSVVFRLDDHIQRLADSCKIVGIEFPFPTDVVVRACVDLLKVNGLDEAYARPLVYLGDGAMGLYASNPSRLAIIVWRWGAYLGDAALASGIRCKVSSFTRHHVNSSMVKGKIVGHYVNSIMAKREAKAAGYDEALMLDHQGYVSEGSGENIFFVKHGMLQTPPFSSAILGGLTRDTVITIARDMGLRVKAQSFTRDELWLADEVFLTGTAAEVTPVVEVDNRRIGDGRPGEITRSIQKRFFEILRGENREYEHWMTEYRL
ncbi:MAG: branched-chain amino acid transaminase [Deltaproteobacteria bacterium]|nr:branched-chain amino acid transaminase [Deltaproteobacteria bacterium]